MTNKRSEVRGAVQIDWRSCAVTFSNLLIHLCIELVGHGRYRLTTANTGSSFPSFVHLHLPLPLSILTFAE